MADDMNIWIAASDGDVAVVEQYLQQGVSVNAKDHTGYSPLSAAVSYSHFDLVKLLLERGADPNICDNDGDSPLHLCEDVAVAKLLLAAGADGRANLAGITAGVACRNEEQDAVADVIDAHFGTVSVATNRDEDEDGDDAEGMSDDDDDGQN
eukprot:m.28481 g.28481  ORF g.28481 m.28481 type:complete len:152 (-) comp10282_c0_seq1:253-708(-)